MTDTFRCAGHEFEANKWDARCALNMLDGTQCTMTLPHLETFEDKDGERNSDKHWAHSAHLTQTEVDEIEALKKRRNEVRQRCADCLAGA